MHAISTTFVLMLIVMVTNAATGIIPAQEKPAEFADKEGCYLEHLKKVIPYGEYYPRRSCAKYICNTSNQTKVFTCPLHGKPEEGSPCELISDVSLDYPDCCPQLSCGQSSKSGIVSDEIIAAPVVEQSSNSGVVSEETSSVPVVEQSSISGIASEETTSVPVVEHHTTTGAKMPGPCGAPSQ